MSNQNAGRHHRHHRHNSILRELNDYRPIQPYMGFQLTTSRFPYVGAPSLASPLTPLTITPPLSPVRFSSPLSPVGMVAPLGLVSPPYVLSPHSAYMSRTRYPVIPSQLLPFSLTYSANRESIVLVIRKPGTPAIPGTPGTPGTPNQNLVLLHKTNGSILTLYAEHINNIIPDLYSKTRNRLYIENYTNAIKKVHSDATFGTTSFIIIDNNTLTVDGIDIASLIAPSDNSGIWLAVNLDDLATTKLSADPADPNYLNISLPPSTTYKIPKTLVTFIESAAAEIIAKKPASVTFKVVSSLVAPRGSVVLSTALTSTQKCAFITVV